MAARGPAMPYFQLALRDMVYIGDENNGILTTDERTPEKRKSSSLTRLQSGGVDDNDIEVEEERESSEENVYNYKRLLLLGGKLSEVSEP